MKKLTKKVTAVLLAFSMVMPAGGTAMPVEAAEDTPAQTQTVAIAVQSEGGALTVKDTAGQEYKVDAGATKKNIQVEVGSKLYTTAAAEGLTRKVREARG